MPSGVTIQLLIELASRCGGHIVGGLVERDGDHFYNTAVIVGPSGYVGKHRKVHLAPPDKPYFQSGDEFRVFEIAGIRVGVLLCFDIWFEGGIGSLKQQGGELVLNSSNYCGEDSLDTITRQAIEHSVAVIAANRLGMDHDVGTDVRFIGSSLIVGPDGTILEQASREPVFTVREIELSMLQSRE